MARVRTTEKKSTPSAAELSRLKKPLPKKSQPDRSM